MSTYAVIACDVEISPGERCMTEDSPPGLPRSATKARALLARQGWHRTRHGDVCPDCRTSGRRPPRPTKVDPGPEGRPVIAPEPAGGQPAPAWHWGPHPTAGHQTRHKGPRETCPGPDCEPEHPALVLGRAADLLETVQAYIADGSPLPDEMPHEQWDRACKMHPDVRTALARMLRQAADALEGTVVPDGEPALAVARALLAEEDR